MCQRSTIAAKNRELLPNGTDRRSRSLGQPKPYQPKPYTSPSLTNPKPWLAASGIRAELPASRAGGGTAEPVADRREYVPNRGDSIARGGNDLILEVKRLGEQRIGVAGKPV